MCFVVFDRPFAFHPEKSFEPKDWRVFLGGPIKSIAIFNLKRFEGDKSQKKDFELQNLESS